MRGATNSVVVVSMWQEHGDRLLGYLTRLLGTRQEAEDVAQETYLKLYRICRPDEVKCHRALLFDAATKLAFERLRRRRDDPIDNSVGEGINEIPDTSPLPDLCATMDQAMKELVSVIEELEPSLRTPFVCRFVQQMPRDEIAQRMNTTTKGIELRLTRALAFCRQRMESRGASWPNLL